jgi:HEPN domain-containing protein
MSNLSPIVFANHAHDFVAAAKRESQIVQSGLSMPAYFLAARAIELGLKSYLLLSGKGEAELRKLSHDLGKALDTAKKAGLHTAISVSPETEKAIRWINEYYQRKDLEYPTTGYKTYPPLGYLLDFADALTANLESQRRQWRPSTTSPSPPG